MYSAVGRERVGLMVDMVGKFLDEKWWSVGQGVGHRPFVVLNNSSSTQLSLGNNFFLISS